MMETTVDGFLGGRLSLRQPARGFRAGSDAVLLAAACPAVAGESVLDLGCGVGTAMLCVAARVSGVRAHGVERDADTAALARENGAEVTQADLAELPADLRNRSFDHVIANPPYFGPGSPADDPAREAALRDLGALPLWCDTACKRAGPKGSVTFIARADRLADLLAGLAPRLGRIVVQPIAARVGEAAGRVIVQGHKGARAPLILRAPFHTHDGDQHSAQAQAILRDAAALRLR